MSKATFERWNRKQSRTDTLAEQYDGLPSMLSVQPGQSACTSELTTAWP